MNRSALLVVLSTGFATTTLFAQPCHCSDEFLSLQHYMEKNYAGFKDKVTANNRAAYDSTTAAAYHRAVRTEKPLFCLALMKQWLKFFRDGHNYITPNLKSGLPNQTGETIRLTAAKLAALEGRTSSNPAAPKNIEGIYYHNDSTYKIAIVKSKTKDRDYAGVILDSRTPSWQPGQVKLELLQISPTDFHTIIYLRDHSADVEDFVLEEDASFNKGEWFRAGKAAPETSATGNAARGKAEHPLLQTTQLDNQTLYIAIGSFDDPYAAAIDSLIRADSAMLRSMPNLILDLRGNGGGSDFVYEPLMPWLYTDPVHGIGVDVLATDDNIKTWSALLDDKYIDNWTRFRLQNTIARMKKMQPGQFIPFTQDGTTTLPAPRPFPKHVAVLMDSVCASTAEQFLLESAQSNKVVLMGQHSSGVLDYANVREHPFECLPFTLSYATTRSRRIDQGKGIDNIGIQPAVVLKNEEDWVEAAKKYLER